MPRRVAAFIRHAGDHQLGGCPSDHQPFALTEEGERRAASSAVDLRHALDQFDALAEPGLGSAANLTVAQIEQVSNDNPRHPCSGNRAVTIVCRCRVPNHYSTPES